MPQATNRRLSALCDCCIAPFAATGVNRRRLLADGAATATTGPAAGAPKAFARAAPHRIDVHHHVSPPTWLAAVKSIKQDQPPMANWSVRQSLDDMDAGGVATAITSPTTPQVTGFDKATAARLARESNEYCKKLESDHKGRFGTFAMLPFPHIDACLEEIAYAFDVLKVDGIGCMTSYGDKWLGYAEFEPVWEELNRRKATVYTHPTVPHCCVNLVRGISDVYIEFGTDTTRSLFSLIFSGSSQKNKHINWIWSHGGGALTAFAERFLVQALIQPPYAGKIARETVESELRRFYYDTAQVANHVTLSAMVQLMPISQIVYGTDFPFRTAADNTKGVTAFFKGDDLKAVDRDNALRLIPRLNGA